MCSYGMAGGCFTDIVLLSLKLINGLKNYREERQQLVAQGF